MSPAKKRGTLSVVEATQPSYKVADVAEVEQAASEMKDPMLQCRDFGHTWSVASIIRQKGHYVRELWCKRCKTNREQVLSFDGEVLDSHYSYQEGYQLKGMGRILSDGKMALRREALDRALAAGKIHDLPDEEEDAPPARKRA